MSCTITIKNIVLPEHSNKNLFQQKSMDVRRCHVQPEAVPALQEHQIRPRVREAGHEAGEDNSHKAGAHKHRARDQSQAVLETRLRQPGPVEPELVARHRGGHTAGPGRRGR